MATTTRSFGADPAVVGTTLYLNFRPFTVVGVAAAEFLGTDSGLRPDVPATAPLSLTNRARPRQRLGRKLLL